MRRVQPFLDHWYNTIANGDNTVFDKCMQFLAHIIQYPQTRTGWCMVLIGDQGVGKNLAMSPLQTALGPYARQECNPERLVSRFNGMFKDNLLVCWTKQMPVGTRIP
ncbi:hypothetical protein GHT06_003809 [Daphnia sinensis]|uniref:Uncharacterized protein n=1 Tax=Daphnia sinensis TaxID=1820382 RepID=A0AAD5KTV2_9CRUS|nr:hypothetical protein GHT06_003809 [Daphnia sinensis]